MSDQEIAILTPHWEASEAVARGAAWLDSQEPGWADTIDVATLNMRSGDLCVAGQAYPGGYNAMEETLREAGEFWYVGEEWYGFTHPDRSNYAGSRDHLSPALQDLQDLWLAQIRQRLTVGS